MCIRDRSITERPDLFAAAVDGVPSSDTVREETSANGPPNIPEFGSVATEDGFKGLLEMSSYAHVKAGTKYPAMMVTAGVNDPRVDPWQGAKMAARLQAATASGKPVLLLSLIHISRLMPSASSPMGPRRPWRSISLP